jgi:demethylmenaquinone methyltransferase/2-methoxy-6-polyprenyl-1,4-benzoquinol methylase
VRAMFAGIAGRYDLLNHLLSGNIDKRWRRAVAQTLESSLVEGSRVLDVACGTGDLSLVLSRAGAAQVVGLDFCRPMLEIARRKAEADSRTVPFVEGDALRLPFADETFDAVTIAFGLRNLAGVLEGLKELRRILRWGGRLAVLEFSSPVVPGFRALFRFYFARVLPRIGGLVSGSRGAYEYLPDSVSRFPDQKRLAGLMQDAGFENVGYRNLTGGIAALHTGTRAAGS